MEIPKEISDMSDEELDKAIHEKYGDFTDTRDLPDDPLVFELLKRISTGE